MINEKPQVLNDEVVIEILTSLTNSGRPLEGSESAITNIIDMLNQTHTFTSSNAVNLPLYRRYLLAIAQRIDEDSTTEYIQRIISYYMEQVRNLES